MKISLFVVSVLVFSRCFINAGMAQDAPQWGEKHTRNMVSPAGDLPERFNPETGMNIKWVADIGSHGYATPVVANGKVLIGANNAAQYNARHEGDRGTLLCFSEEDGRFLWQLTVPRIEGDRHHDWPMIGICSPPTVEGDRIYILTNRSEVLCFDLNGQADGNDGPFLGESWYMAPSGEFPMEVTPKDADIIWMYDLRLQLGIRPHDSPHASILIDGDFFYLNTCNGVDHRHLETTSLKAPSLIALNKRTGRLAARDNENFGPRIFHSSWSSPALGEINGQKLIFFAGPDGIVYAFEALDNSTKNEKPQHFKKVWQRDCDPNSPKNNIHDYLKNREESPSNFLGMPVFYKNRIYVTGGGDIWWGKQECWLKCFDAANGTELWSTELEQHSAATPAISDGLVYVTDCGKNLHCIDAETGARYWKHPMKRDAWGSALAADGKIFAASRGSDFWIIEQGKKLNVLDSVQLDSPIHTTPVVANGVMYISTMRKLYAVEKKIKKTAR
ncbi:MAG: PQQ-binding-like beta-propeller repeat protein [Tangfeifania sp.]